VGRRSQYPEKREEIVRAISGLLAANHRTPSVREVADEVDLSIATLHSYLGKLNEEGLIEWRTRRHRSIMLTREGEALAATGVPF